jgi:hypothetical protein
MKLKGWNRFFYSSLFVFRAGAMAFRDLLAGSAMAAALGGTAISRLGKFAVRPNAGLRHGAPEEAIA